MRISWAEEIVTYKLNIVSSTFTFAFCIYYSYICKLWWNERMNDWSACIQYHQWCEWAFNGCVQLSPIIRMIGQLDMYNILMICCILYFKMDTCEWKFLLVFLVRHSNEWIFGIYRVSGLRCVSGIWMICLCYDF